MEQIQPTQMSRQDAFKVMQICDDASASEIQKKYQELYSEFQLRHNNAPTPKLKMRYETNLKNLKLALESLFPKDITEIEKYYPSTEPTTSALTGTEKTNIHLAENQTALSPDKSGDGGSRRLARIYTAIAATIILGALAFGAHWRANQILHPVGDIAHPEGHSLHPTGDTLHAQGHWEHPKGDGVEHPEGHFRHDYDSKTVTYNTHEYDLRHEFDLAHKYDNETYFDYIDVKETKGDYYYVTLHDYDLQHSPADPVHDGQVHDHDGTTECTHISEVSARECPRSREAGIGWGALVGMVKCKQHDFDLVPCSHARPCQHKIPCTHKQRQIKRTPIEYTKKVEKSRRVDCTHRIDCKHQVPCTHTEDKMEATPCTHKYKCNHTIACSHKTECDHIVPCEHPVVCEHLKPCEHKRGWSNLFEGISNPFGSA